MEVPEEQNAIDNTVEIIEYIPSAVVIKTKMKKSKGSISVMSFDSSEGLKEKKSPFNTFVQIIEGKTEIAIDGTPIVLETGQSLTIPANKASIIKPKGHFKMVQTVIKRNPE